MLDGIYIRNSAQIPRLAAHLVEDPSRARHVRSLYFDLSYALRPNNEGDKVKKYIKWTHDLAPIPLILQMTCRLKSLFDVPMLSADYSTIMSLIRALSKLDSLSVTQQFTYDVDLFRNPDLQEISSLCHSMDVVEDLYLELFDLEALQPLCVR